VADETIYALAINHDFMGFADALFAFGNQLAFAYRAGIVLEAAEFAVLDGALNKEDKLTSFFIIIKYPGRRGTDDEVAVLTEGDCF